MATRHFPLVRACGFGSLPDLIEERMGERYMLELFERENLPVQLRDMPDTPMPLAAMMGLFFRGARILGQRTFGLEVGERMTHRGYGLWAEYSASAPTLGGALRRAVFTSAAHMSGARLELVPDQDRWVWRFVMPEMAPCRMQHADHMLVPMLTLVRQYLGPDWQPDWLEVSYPRDPAADEIETWLRIPVRFRCAGTGVSLRLDDLRRSRRGDGPMLRRGVTLREVQADVILKDAPEPARAVSALVALRLLDGETDIEGTARLAGLSVQGLQRRLRQKGYTYREIVDQARQMRARCLVLDTEWPLIEIALALGYQDQANFSRAFVRWFGCAPSDLRRAGAGRMAWA
ncbi:MAG: helix-turn-helix domain-containing protein [Acetobacteraceae bacterium]